MLESKKQPDMALAAYIKTGVPGSMFCLEIADGFITGRTDAEGVCAVDLEDEAVLTELRARRFTGTVDRGDIADIKIYAMRPPATVKLTLEVNGKKSGLAFEVPGPHDDDMFMLHLENAVAQLFAHEYKKRFGAEPARSTFRPRSTCDIADLDEPTLGKYEVQSWMDPYRDALFIKVRIPGKNGGPVRGVLIRLAESVLDSHMEDILPNGEYPEMPRFQKKEAGGE